MVITLQLCLKFTKTLPTLLFIHRIESQEDIIDSSLEDSDISRDKTLPTALPYKETNQLENQDPHQETVPDIEYQDPSTPDGFKSPTQSKSESTDTIEICEPQIPR